MPPKQITLERRDNNIMVWTTSEVKKQLQAIADERGWSLSLLCHEVLRSWLEESRYHGDIRWGEEEDDDMS